MEEDENDKRKKEEEEQTGNKEEKKEEEEPETSDVFEGSLNVLGTKIDIGKLFSLPPGKVARDIGKLRDKLEKEVGEEVKVHGYVRSRPLRSERPGRDREKMKTIRLDVGSEEPEPLEDVFDEGDKLRVLAEIPLHLRQEDIQLNYEKNNGGGELIIKTEDYERIIPIENAELTGKINLVSVKSGIINVELEKQKEDK